MWPRDGRWRLAAGTVTPLFLVVAATLSFLASATASGVAASAGPQITGKQIKDGAVRSRHVTNGSVASRDLRDGSLTGKDFAGGRLVGPRGLPGPDGQDGKPGLLGAPGVLGLEYQAATGELVADSRLELVAMCSSANKIVVGGGVGATDADETEMENSNAVVVNGVYGWHASAYGSDNVNGQPNTLRVWAICVDRPQ